MRSTACFRARFSPLAHAAALAVGTLVAPCSFGAGALPTGLQVVQGQVSALTQGNQLTVRNSPGAILNWQSFSIAAGNKVWFDQAGASSKVLNRVVGNDPSAIFGSLGSNGQVWLLNPNGVLFGAGATVNVQSLLTSTLRLNDNDFLAGRYSFASNVGEHGVVRNEGRISSASGGQIVLLGSRVENAGTIEAPGGNISLAAAGSVELVDTGLPNLSVRVDVPQGETINLGKLQAPGGSIDVFGAIVNQQGFIQADSFGTDAQGRITLQAGDTLTLAEGSVTQARGSGAADRFGRATLDGGGLVRIEGKVDVGSSTGLGGELLVQGARILLGKAALLDASGANGGGRIRLGGDYQGRNSAVRNAEMVTVAPGAQLKADATDSGPGGRVIVWSDVATRFAGQADAKGGANGGDGGLVEVSSKGWLDFRGSSDRSAPQGRAGQLLLDPTNLTIQAASPDLNGDGSLGDDLTSPTLAFAAAGGNSVITAAAVNSQLATGAVTLQSTNNVQVNAAINGSFNSLTLQAGNQIVVSAPISLGSGSLTLSANDAAGLPSGFGFVTLGAALTASSVFITNGGGTGVHSLSSSITASTLDINGTMQLNGTNTWVLSGFSSTIANNIQGTGALVKAGTGGLTLSAPNTYSGGTTVNAGTLIIGTSSDAIGTGTLTLGGGTLSTGSGNTLAMPVVLSASGGTLDVSAGTTTVGGTISGTGSLTKTGAGSLTLTQSNGYSGATLINAGTLNVGSGGVTGSLGAGNVTNDGVLSFNHSNAINVAQTIGGSGSVVQAGSGITTLSGANTYAGNTTVNTGSLATTGAQRLPSSTTVNLAAGATLSLGGDQTLTGLYLSGTLDSSGNLVVTNTFSQTGGTASVTGNVSITQAAGNLDLGHIGAGSINATAQAGSLTVNGALFATGDVTLVAQGANSDVTVASNITGSGAAGKTLTLQADNNVIVGAAAVLSSTQALNIVLNSDHDASGTGNIQIGTGSVVSSAGGSIVMGGGTTPASGYAIGAGGALPGASGIYIDGDITAGAGNVTMHGKSSANAGDGITFNGGTLSSDGAVSIDGITFANGSLTDNHSFVAGVRFLNTGSRLTTSSGTVTVTGLSNGNGLRTQGVMVDTATIETTGSGTLTLNGTSSSTDTDWGVGLYSGAVVRTTASGGGSLTLNGRSLAGDSGLFMLNASVTSAGGEIHMSGQSASGESIGIFSSTVGGSASGDILLAAPSGSSGAIDLGSFPAFGSSTVNAGSNSLTIALSGQTATDAGDPANSITAARLRLIGSGTFTLDSASNNIATLAAVGTGISYRNSGALAIGSVTSFDGVSNTTTDGVAAFNLNINVGGGSATLTVQPGVTLAGQGTITGNLTNFGSLRPNSEGINPSTGTVGVVGNLNVTGDLDLTNGVLAVDLGGTGAGLSSNIAVTGNVTLGGTVSGTLVNGYAPVNGDFIPLVTTAGTPAGTFATTSLPTGFTPGYSLASGEAVRLIYAATPSTRTFTNAAGDLNWGTPSNWTGAALPGSADAALISSGFAVAHASGADAIASLTIDTGNSLNVSGGSLTVSGTTALSGALSVTGSGSATLTGAVTGGGSAAVSGGGNLSLNGAASFGSVNLSGGTLQGTGSLTVSSSFSRTAGAAIGTGFSSIDLTQASGDLTPGSLQAGTIRLTTSSAGSKLVIDDIVSASTSSVVNAAGALQVLGDQRAARLGSSGTQSVTADSILVRGGASGTGQSGLIIASNAQSITTTGIGGITMQGGGADNNSAEIRSVSGSQTFNMAGGTLALQGGGGGANSFAIISAASGLQTLTGADGITLTGGGGGTGNRALLLAGGNQAITVGAGGVTLKGGAGTDAFAMIQQDGSVAGTSQTLTIDGGGTVLLQGGSSPSAGGQGSYASIEGIGVAQNLIFNAGGSLTAIGGTVGSGNSASVDASGSSGNVQTITGAPTLSLTGGASGGSVGQGNGASISATGAQTISAGSLQLQGGASGVENTASVQGRGTTQRIDVTGAMGVQSGTGGTSNAAAVFGTRQIINVGTDLTIASGGTASGASFGGGAGISAIAGTPVATSTTVAAGGNITLTGSSAANSGAFIGDGFNSTQPMTVSVSAGGNITLNPGTPGGSGSFIGTDPTSTGVTSGSLTVSAPNGRVFLNGLIAGAPAGGTLLSTPGALSVSGATLDIGGAVKGNTIVAAGSNGITLRDAATLASSATSGDALVVTTANGPFVNSVGASVLSTAGTSRWLVYSATPVADTVAGLAATFRQYNAPTGTTPLGTGNGLLYSLAPSLTAALQGNVSKVYDRSTSATLLPANVALSGALTGDSVVLNSATNGAYDTASVGSGKTVTLTGATVTVTDAASGYPVFGYSFSGTATGAIGTITPAALAVSGIAVASKVYNGSTAGTLASTGSVTPLAGDVVALGGPGTATFVDKNVGTGKSVSVAGLTLTGTDAGNYTLTPPTGLTASITAAPLSLAGVVVNNKVYDTTAVATLASTGGITPLSGDVVSLGGTASAAFADKNVGTGKAVTVTGLSLTGADAGNYTLLPPAGLAASITPAALVLGTVTVANKSYDGSTAATATGSLSGVLAGDAVTASLSARFADQNAGVGKPVAYTATAIGADAANYTLTTGSGSAAADISAVPLTYVAAGALGVAGSARPALTGSVLGFVAGDTLSTATTGTLTWTTPATSASAPGRYAINGGGLSALNYSFTQAAGNSLALLLTAEPVSNAVTAVATTATALGLQQVQVGVTMSTPTAGRVLDVTPLLAPSAPGGTGGETSNTFQAVNFNQLPRDEVQSLLAARDRYKRQIFARSISRLEQDPTLADVRPCRTTAEMDKGDCLVTDALKEEIRQAIAAKSVQVRRPSGRKVKQAVLPTIERKLALLIGVNEYTDKRVPELSGAVPDVQAVQAVLESRLGYETTAIANPTREAIIRAFNKLTLEAQPNDSVVIYYAGHGVVVPVNGVDTGFWLPADVNAEDPATWLSNGDIARLVAGLAARQLMLVSDSCYSGTLAGNERVQVSQTTDAAPLLSRRAVVVMSSGGNEPVADEGREGHSIFAWHFIKALEGLDNWQVGGNLYERVRAAVTKEFPQTPQYGASSRAGHQGNTDYLFERREFEVRAP